MYKTFLVAVVAVVAVSMTGCAWVNSSTVFKMDSTGNLVQSEYSRKVTGFSADKESSETWAFSDQQVRNNKMQTLSGDKNSTHNRGLVISRKSQFRTAAIYRVDCKKPVLIFAFDRQGQNEGILPDGEYYTIWSNGKDKVQGENFYVYPGKKIKYTRKKPKNNKQEFGWIQYLD